MTTRGPFGTTSSAVNVLPTSGRVLSTSKKPAPALNASTRSGAAPPDSVTFSSRFGEMIAEEAPRGAFRVFDTRDAAVAWLEELGDEAGGG